MLINNPASDFLASALLPDQSIINNFQLSQYCANAFTLLFFYPLDFTFVCPTEILALRDKNTEFTKHNVKIVTVSVDSVYTHHKWSELSLKDGGIGAMPFPMVSDIKKEISLSYNTLSKDGINLRAVVIIDDKFMVRYFSVHDLVIGRNIDELLRIAVAFQAADKNNGICPSVWKIGDPVVQPEPIAINNYINSQYK